MGAHQDRRYFPLLDGIRGLAAIAVMFRHMSLFGVHSIAQSYLGVDVFFALSGAVVASAYEQKLLTGLDFGQFLGRRALRLWPMIALGVCLGVINAVWGQPETPMQGRLWIYALLALIVGDLPFVSAFGFNRPSWTMTFELAVNIVYARIVRWLTWPVLVAICGLGAVGLVWAARVSGGLDTGSSLQTLHFGAARTLFAFFVGVGLDRLHRIGRLPVPDVLRSGWGVAACFVLLAACLFAPAPHGFRWIIALLSALLVVPAIVSLGLASQVRGRLAKICLALGAISYPLYLIHDPLAMLVASNLIRHGRSDLLPIGAAVFVPGVIALALAVHYWVDVPVRAWLGKVIITNRGVPQPVPAE
ncbi:MAG: acyltransferase family protein [Caulobacteraceae bacterium]